MTLAILYSLQQKKATYLVNTQARYLLNRQYGMVDPSGLLGRDVLELRLIEYVMHYNSDRHVSSKVLYPPSINADQFNAMIKNLKIA